MDGIQLILATVAMKFICFVVASSGVNDFTVSAVFWFSIPYTVKASAEL